MQTTPPVPESEEPNMRLNQMDTQHIEYRLQQLENEMLPRRMQAAELTISQIQGEVTAMKEIARGIAVKVDSGIEKLSTDNNFRFQELKIDQVRNYSFVKGILWVGGAIATLIGLGPVLTDAFTKMLGH